MKYKVGDKVRVRSDLYDDGIYGGYDFSEEMERYKGKIVTIISTGRDCERDYYEIEEDDTKYAWTDEMFEGLEEEELTAEEAIKIQAEMCRSVMCKDCTINKFGYDTRYGCCEYRLKNPDKVLKILKQWKKEHEKKEVETEIAYIIRVMKEEGDNETCIYTYEVDISKEDINEKMKELVKKCYEEHGGKIYAKYELIYRVKS
jgi:uridine phosphorylase